MTPYPASDRDNQPTRETEMGTKLNPGQYDCHAKAEPDEPIFTLRAKDPSAACLVWLWATMAEIQDGQEPGKVREARQLMADMIEWSHAKGIKSNGLGIAALSAVVEMIRAANAAVKKLLADASVEGLVQDTTVEMFRLYFAAATVDAGE
jgi:hypothetical protein